MTLSGFPAKLTTTLDSKKLAESAAGQLMVAARVGGSVTETSKSDASTDDAHVMSNPVPALNFWNKAIITELFFAAFT